MFDAATFALLRLNDVTLSLQKRAALILFIESSVSLEFKSTRRNSFEKFGGASSL